MDSHKCFPNFLALSAIILDICGSTINTHFVRISLFVFFYAPEFSHDFWNYIFQLNEGYFQEKLDKKKFNLGLA